MTRIVQILIAPNDASWQGRLVGLADDGSVWWVGPSRWEPCIAPIECPDQLAALVTAEAALADIGDSDREPGDDVAWCERRAAQALPAVRAAIAKAEGKS